MSFLTLVAPRERLSPPRWRLRLLRCSRRRNWSARRGCRVRAALLGLPVKSDRLAFGRGVCCTRGRGTRIVAQDGHEGGCMAFGTRGQRVRCAGDPVRDNGSSHSAVRGRNRAQQYPPIRKGFGLWTQGPKGGVRSRDLRGDELGVRAEAEKGWADGFVDFNSVARGWGREEGEVRGEFRAAKQALGARKRQDGDNDGVCAEIAEEGQAYVLGQKERVPPLLSASKRARLDLVPLTWKVLQVWGPLFWLGPLCAVIHQAPPPLCATPPRAPGLSMPTVHRRLPAGAVPENAPVNTARLRTRTAPAGGTVR
eukprot:gb/GEZJ01002245.1/.p1 GENE.gb/GEZJ01002245.1/~~gb/GEZJ01002245.1/.p1  ORF type:complete len:310 (-),score=10.51 gb/GEZJ01002245.1/:300-1229(-)